MAHSEGTSSGGSSTAIVAIVAIVILVLIGVFALRGGLGLRGRGGGADSPGLKGNVEVNVPKPGTPGK
jgi:hypothetical protein